MLNKKTCFSMLLLALAMMPTLFNSCKEKVQTVEVPELYHVWQWKSTSVGGFVGLVYPEADKPLVFEFDSDNRLNVEYDGEMLATGEQVTVTKSNNTTYGDYYITLPKQLQKKIRQRTGQTEANLILEGYLRFEYPDNGETWLFITSKDGKNVGVEGGADFHGQTCFARGMELHQ